MIVIRKKSLFRVNLVLILGFFLLFNSSIFSQDNSYLKTYAPFPIGVAVGPKLLSTNETYRHVVASEYSSISSEGGLKWLSLHPSEKVYDFREGDMLVNFAEKYRIRIHGHNLCWYYPNPAWIYKFNGNSKSWDSLLRTYIDTVVTHYKGKIRSWDVVNEAFRDDGTMRIDDMDTTDKVDDGCIWARKIGVDYIQKAFIYAHMADPDALLFYNDYDMEYSPQKLKAILSMVKKFSKDKIPINGLGLQFHLTPNSSKEGIRMALKLLSATGLQIHISELDVRVNSKRDSSFIYSNDVQKNQALMYEFVVKMYKSIVPKKQQYGITLWNVGDGDSWILKSFKTADFPLLFDKDYNHKSVYYIFRNALKN